MALRPHCMSWESGVIVSIPPPRVVVVVREGSELSGAALREGCGGHCGVANATLQLLPPAHFSPLARSQDSGSDPKITPDAGGPTGLAETMILSCNVVADGQRTESPQRRRNSLAHGRR